MNDGRQPDTGCFFQLDAGLSEATNVVTAFHPAVVYPYHYRDSSGATVNAAAFKQQLRQDLGVEVRLRKWY